MSGDDMRELRDAVVGALKLDELRQAVDFADLPFLSQINFSQPLQSIVFDLLEAARRAGKLPELVLAVVAANPGNPALQAFLKRVVAAGLEGKPLKVPLPPPPLLPLHDTGDRDESGAADPLSAAGRGHDTGTSGQAKRPHLKGRSLGGYYSTSWEYITDDSARTSRKVHDIVLVEQKYDPARQRDLIEGRVIFSTDPARRYEFSGSAISDGAFTRYVGQWQNIANGDYSGDFSVYVEVTAPLRLFGFWAGLGLDKELQIQRWTWTKIDVPRQPAADNLFDPAKHRAALTRFIELHELKGQAGGEQVEQVEGLELQIVPGVFNPALGNVSQHFYSLCVKPLESKAVLDVGTGSGFYALAAARQGCRVTACDVSHEAIQVAEANATRNGIGGVRFVQGSVYQGLPPGEEFDVILSNLPFTSEENGQPILHTRYFQSLCLGREELADFVLGAYYRLKPGGSAYFTFGTSGDTAYFKLLQQLIPRDVTLKTLKVIDRLTDLGERFYIYQLQRSP